MEEHSQRKSSGMRWEDAAVYGLVLAGIYFLVGVLFFYAGKEKIFDGLGAPAGIERQFSGTSRRKPFLLSALALAIFTFSILAIGQNVVGENEGVAELFLYAGATGVLFGLVLLMPPHRPPTGSAAAVAASGSRPLPQALAPMWTV